MHILFIAEPKKTESIKIKTNKINKSIIHLAFIINIVFRTLLVTLVFSSYCDVMLEA